MATVPEQTAGQEAAGREAACEQPGRHAPPLRRRCARPHPVRSGRDRAHQLGAQRAAGQAWEGLPGLHLSLIFPACMQQLALGQPAGGDCALPVQQPWGVAWTGAVC